MRDPDTGWLQLTGAELALLIAAARRTAPAILDLPHPARTPAHFAELCATASAALESRDLGTVTEPAADLAGAVAALCGAGPRLELCDDGPAGRLLGLLVPYRGAAVLALAYRDDVRLRAVPGTGLADTLLTALDPAPAGPGRSANVAWADYQRACAAGSRGGSAEFLRVLVEAGVRQSDAHTVLRVLLGRVGGGRIEPAGRAGDGTALDWVDTDDGRYVLRQRSGWLSITPADPAKLRSLIEDLLAGATSGYPEHG